MRLWPRPGPAPREAGVSSSGTAGAEARVPGLAQPRGAPARPESTTAGRFRLLRPCPRWTQALRQFRRARRRAVAFRARAHAGRHRDLPAQTHRLHHRGRLSQRGFRLRKGLHPGSCSRMSCGHEVRHTAAADEHHRDLRGPAPCVQHRCRLPGATRLPGRGRDLFGRRDQGAGRDRNHDGDTCTPGPSVCTWVPVTCTADTDCADPLYQCVKVGEYGWCSGSGGTCAAGETCPPPDAADLRHHGDHELHAQAH